MDQTILLRTIQPADRCAVMELHREHYWRSHCLLLNPEFYRWQFELPPDQAAAGGDQSLVALDEEGRLLSFMGLVLARCSWRGRTLRGVHFISWLTAPRARGQGLGRQTLASLTERFDFLFSRSPTPASLTVFRRLGFRYFRPCSRWIAVLDAEATLRLAVDASGVAARRAQARRVPEGAPANYSIGRQMPAGAPGLAHRVLSQCLTFDRTESHLRWRYEKHPCLHYDWLWVGDAQAPDGVAVVRVEDVSGRPGRVLRVVEFFAAPAAAVRLAAAVFAFGRDQQCAFADAFGMSERFVAGLVAAGGFHTLEEPDLPLPYLFQPWTPEIEAPGLLFFGRHGAAEESGIGCTDDVSQMHVTKGDGNMDWPSWHPTGNAVPLAPAVAGPAAA
jgi:GNAT superfamily N-acetyltransferase